ncbi:amidase [Pseudomonas stutzeri]|uniref:amidase n=1 Tax=Stutzerimonas stutzeri TaxID=316 RepID=UPI00210A0EC2|nr:amidase [Stutzerimonas stutzeri]MCQ4298111.1 amidase [Stutzerimonas stutzeri]
MYVFEVYVHGSLSALQITRAYAAGLTDPVEVFEAALATADELPGAFISLSAERGRREALASRSRWQAGQALSVLDGVPVAWKDMFDVAGSVTTAGSATRRELAPAIADAALVGALTRAGLVTLGKTNLSEFAYSGLGLNPHFGTPINPCSGHTPRVPGGSSSGSAVAVAAGVVPLAMGTDTAGSIRVPAAFNGLVGYRSSRCRYAFEGVFPLARSLDALGPLARTVEDVVAVDTLLRGGVVSSCPTALSLAGLRLYVDLAWVDDSCVQPAVRQNLEQSLERLARAGAVIERKPIMAMREALAMIDRGDWVGSAEAFALHERLLDSADAGRLDPRVRKRLEGARSIRASHQIRLYQQAESLRKQLADELDGAFVITPTVAHVAPLLAPLEADEALFVATNLATLRLTMPGSLLDMPGVALPSGVDEHGLPTSLLLAAPSAADDLLLRAALAVESALLP